MNLPNLIHRLRRVASGESAQDVYGTNGSHPSACRVRVSKDREAWANACFDKTPITEEWIRELGVFEKSRANDDFLYCWCKHTVVAYDTRRGSFDKGMVGVTTRGQLIQLLSALGVWDGDS